MLWSRSAHALQCAHCPAARCRASLCHCCIQVALLSGLCLFWIRIICQVLRLEYARLLSCFSFCSFYVCFSLLLSPLSFSLPLSLSVNILPARMRMRMTCKQRTLNWSYEPPCGYWELNPGPLKEQRPFATELPSLKPLILVS